MNKQEIINMIIVIFIIIITGYMFFIVYDTQIKAYEECIKTYVNCSTVIN